MPESRLNISKLFVLLKRVHNLLCLRFHPVSDGSTLGCTVLQSLHHTLSRQLYDAFPLCDTVYGALWISYCIVLYCSMLSEVLYDSELRFFYALNGSCRGTLWSDVRSTPVATLPEWHT